MTYKQRLLLGLFIILVVGLLPSLRLSLSSNHLIIEPIQPHEHTNSEGLYQQSQQQIPHQQEPPEEKLLHRTTLDPLITADHAPERTSSQHDVVAHASTAVPQKSLLADNNSSNDEMIQPRTNKSPLDGDVSADPCTGYDGIFLISQILPNAGVGTVFYQSIMASLLFAKRYNLYPWIHVTKKRRQRMWLVVYDDKVHGEGTGNCTFSHLSGEISNVVGTGGMRCSTPSGHRPGPPMYDKLKVQQFELTGNGVWASYFEPVLPIPKLDEGSACSSLPIFQFSFYQATVGTHKCSEFNVRAWPYDGIPRAFMPQANQSMHEWLWENRKRAAPVVQEYYRPLEWLQKRIDAANPVTDRKCMSMHVRLTDKANGRDKKDVEAYLEHALTFVNITQFKFPIYLATDDATVVAYIREKLAPATVWIQENIMRSETNTPTFELLRNDVHRSNSETLVDIYGLAKCSYFVHGFSGMSEAVVYISPDLHEKSINVDEPNGKAFRRVRQSLLQQLLQDKLSW